MAHLVEKWPMSAKRPGMALGNQTRSPSVHRRVGKAGRYGLGNPRFTGALHHQQKQ
jgi:hypothetical protein